MKLRPFELSLVLVFGGLGLFALIMLSIYDPDPSQDDEWLARVGAVEIWGTFPAKSVNLVLENLADEDESFERLSYRYFTPDSFDSLLTNALADRVGPDLILVSHEKLVSLRNRIEPISYDSFSLRDVRSTYVDGAEIFALTDGLYGLPIAVDPLMLYWNKDILANKGFLTSPDTWEGLVNDTFPQLIDRNYDRTINKNVIAMGEYRNVRNAFGIISALFLQSGSKGVVEDGDNYGKYSVQLQYSVIGENKPLRMSADFYSRFSNPTNALYSWNRSFPEDRLLFIAEDLAFYFGYGSEGVQIERKNPNLNFDISEIPQGANAQTRRTYGKFYALSLLNSSDNEFGAGIVMSKLSETIISDLLATGNNMSSVSRASVSRGSSDVYGRASFKSASVAFGWLNPDMKEAGPIFQTMTEDINENRNDAAVAANDAASRLSRVY